MSRYLVELTGEIADLEDFPFWLPDGDVYAFAEENCYFLTGPALQVESPELVLEVSEQLLDELVGVATLLWPSLRRPTLGAVCLEDETGKRKRYHFASIEEGIRLRDRTDATVNGMPSVRSGPTEAQRLLEASRRAKHAQTALLLWSDSHRTWPRLYRILEELEAELGTSVSKAGLCSDNERDRFNQSANSSAVAGKDSRHAAGKFAPPKRPMSLSEAASLIGSLLQGTLLAVQARNAA